MLSPSRQVRDREEKKVGRTIQKKRTFKQM
jgi:hypothetical protein